jgi:hypothetical protein
MGKFRIVAAKPKGLVNHVKSQFKLYKYKLVDEKWVWSSIGWKSINDVAALMQAGNEVRSARISGGQIHHGDALELELRIVHNGTKYKVSEMPDP